MPPSFFVPPSSFVFRIIVWVAVLIAISRMNVESFSVGSFPVLVPLHQILLGRTIPSRHGIIPTTTTPMSPRSPQRQPTTVLSLSLSGGTGTGTTGSGGKIEYQADIANYGRGERHLSACLQQGDVVVYQAGQWWVDGVLVGDDDSSTTSTSPTYHYAVVETIQIVWTHNCEHGVIGAWPLSLVRNDYDDDHDRGDSTSTTALPSIMQKFEIENYEMVLFGPEQLVAKLPCRLEEGDATVHVECPPLQLVLMDKRCHPRTAEEDESNEKSD